MPYKEKLKGHVPDNGHNLRSIIFSNSGAIFLKRHIQNPMKIVFDTPFVIQYIFLLSIKDGLRAKEISNLCWSMVTDASGIISSYIHLPDKSSKGKSGRVIPLNTELKDAIEALYRNSAPSPSLDSYVVLPPNKWSRK